MADDDVHLRPKPLGRTQSRRSQILAKFFEGKGDERQRRASKEQLVDKGILKPEPVFGNSLENLPLSLEEKVPEFIVECIKRIEPLISTVGIYRQNGDAAAVQKVRLQINHLNYKILNTKDVTLLTSTLVLFFRELPDPLIDSNLRDELEKCVAQKTKEESIPLTRKVLCQKMPPIWYFTLKYLMKHLKKVGEDPHNRMCPQSLAVVMSPALFSSVIAKRRPQSVMSEIEVNNQIVENFLNFYQEIFED